MRNILTLFFLLLTCGCARNDSVEPAAAAKPILLVPDTVLIRTPIVSSGRVITCSSTAELQSALVNAKAGDRILITPGTYEGTKATSGYSNAYFFSAMNGSPTEPITLQSADSTHPAILKGSTDTTGYVFYLRGSFWQVFNIGFATRRQGIMMDGCNGSFFQNVEGSDIGQEGIHLRDGSSDNYFTGCSVHDCGEFIPDYGEGFYVGSDVGKWGQYKIECDHNTIVRCSTRNTSAESVDIKEGTTGTFVALNVFHGVGISGANGGDSVIDAKGNDAKIYRNTVFRDGNARIIDAFQVHERSPGWGTNNDFRDNSVTLDIDVPYVVRVYSGSARVSSNSRIPAGNMYAGNVTQY